METGDGMEIQETQTHHFLRQQPRLLLQHHSLVSSAVQFGIDVTLSLALLYGLVFIKTGGIASHYLELAAASVLLMMIIYREKGIYSSYLGPVNSIFKLLRSWSLVFVGLVILGFITKTSTLYSREVIIFWFALAAMLQILAHMTARVILRNFRAHELPDNALIIGASEVGGYLAERINNNPWLRSHIIGVVDDNDEALKQWQVKGVPIMGDIAHLQTVINEQNIKVLYIALPASEMEMLQKIYIDSIDSNINVYWTPPIFDLNLVNHNIKQIGNVPVLSLSETPLLGHRAVTKRMLDYTLASIGLIVLSPLMISTAIAVKLSSPGPVLFKQKRHGWLGEVFEVWKFRSMAQHEQTNGDIKQATQNDPRVTRLGRFIRKTSIDELPQLFNVLQGTMSLVGPRPHAVEHNVFYAPKIRAYMARHQIKPGMTGLAQVNGCRGETKEPGEMHRRVDYDMEYINNWSNMLDIKIIIKTVFVLLSDKAY